MNVQDQAALEQAFLFGVFPFEAANQKCGSPVLVSRIRSIRRGGRNQTGCEHGASQVQKLTSGTCHEEMMPFVSRGRLLESCFFALAWMDRETPVARCRHQSGARSYGRRQRHPGRQWTPPLCPRLSRPAVYQISGTWEWDMVHAQPPVRVGRRFDPGAQQSAAL